MFWSSKREEANSLARKIDTGDPSDPDVSFVRFLKSVSPTALGSFDATYDKIFLRLTRVPASDGGRRRRKIKSVPWRTAVASGLTAILLALGLTYTISIRPGRSTDGIIKQALAAV